MPLLCTTQKGQRTMLDHTLHHMNGAQKTPMPPPIPPNLHRPSLSSGWLSDKQALRAKKQSKTKLLPSQKKTTKTNHPKRTRTKLTASPDLIRCLTNPQSYSFVHGWRLEGWDHLLHRLCQGRRNDPERRRDCSPPCHVFGPLFTFWGSYNIWESSVRSSALKGE